MALLTEDDAAKADAAKADAVSYETIVCHIPSKNTVVLQFIEVKLKTKSLIKL